MRACFKGFDCFIGNDTTTRVNSIRETFAKFIPVHNTASRLITYFLKEILEKALFPALKTVHAPRLNIPIMIVPIDKIKSKELLGCNLEDSGTPSFHIRAYHLLARHYW
jgi:hypothetical protein